MRIRIPIREQLAALILLSSLIGLGVISIATWITNRNFVLGVRSTRLTLIASLKASQISSNLALMENSVQFVSSRTSIQNALHRYYQGNNTDSNYATTIPDVQAALGGTSQSGSLGQALLLQAVVFQKNANGIDPSNALLNITGSEVLGQIMLPDTYPNGTNVYLGDDGLGYPAALYPNLTYFSQPYNSTFNSSLASYDGDLLTNTLLLGPYMVNSTYGLLSMTVPIINNTSSVDVLGWLTVVLDARLISDVITSSQGLDPTAELLLVRPTNETNHFPSGVLFDSGSQNRDVINQQQVTFAFPLLANDSDRHSKRVVGTSNPTFPMTSYPAVLDAVTENDDGINNAGALIATTNEQGIDVSCGYALLSTQLCDWAVVVEETRSEVWQPIVALRKVLLACVFGTLGAIILLAWPLAHFISRPIRDLRAATLKSVMPPGYSESNMSLDDVSMLGDDRDGVSPGTEDPPENGELARKEGLFAGVGGWRRRGKKTSAERAEELRRREFRIPGKVPMRKHLIKDELSDLTRTFNEMSDELMMQYERLEERVRQRTAELELSKKAAEMANESKTLFIANISHELKTPLNGILGMTGLCLTEDDPVRLKRSLGIIYKSGDLLLNLLTDLLTFSKNQVGQHLSLDEKEFRLRDVSSQVLAIFDKQAKDADIDLRINFQGGMDDNGNITDSAQKPVGPFSIGGRVKDMILWGDTHRILQVVINLVSNSLKFTPPGGAVTVTIRCTGDAPNVGSRNGSRTGSMQSKASKATKRMGGRQRSSDNSFVTTGKRDSSADAVGMSEKKSVFARITETETVAPPPGRMLFFEFEVTDTGPGIPPEQHQKIFEPFVQGDLGLNKKYGGTGLGLSICSQLAILMRGTIGVESEIDQGSKFVMRIPLRHLVTRADSTASSTVDLHGLQRNGSSSDHPATPHRHSRVEDPTSTQSPTAQGVASQSPTHPSNGFYEQDRQPRLVGLSQPFFASNQPMESPGSQAGAMEQIAASAASSGKIRVLVAEDNAVNQEVVLRMLKLEDIYDVTVAKDGQEALDRVKESMESPDHQPYNLIFMDVQMPNLDGLQSTRLIRETGYSAPIVALTAFSEESNVKDCLDSGMNYFLAKPIRRPALKKVLKEYCAPIQEEPEDLPSAGDANSETPIAPAADAPGQRMSTASDYRILESPRRDKTVIVVSRPSSVDGGGTPRGTPRQSLDTRRPLSREGGML